MLTYFCTVRFLLPAVIVLSAAIAWAAEEAVRTPSDQMKEAINKLGKTPATIGKSLQDMTDSAKERLRQTLRLKAPAETKAEAVNLDLPKKAQPPAAAPVDVRKEGARDPFRPMTLQTKVNGVRPRENLSPLERFELSQLKLVGIVWDAKEPRAMVEDNAGLGYTLKVGTPIGSNEGKVKAIHRNELVVEESFFDVTGARKKRDVSIRLPIE